MNSSSSAFKSCKKKVWFGKYKIGRSQNVMRPIKTDKSDGLNQIRTRTDSSNLARGLIVWLERINSLVGED